jgi:hypothetical protein
MEDMHVAIWTVMKHACTSAKQGGNSSHDTQRVIQNLGFTCRHQVTITRVAANPGEHHAG